MNRKLETFLMNKYGHLIDPENIDHNVYQKISPHCSFISSYHTLTKHYHAPISQMILAQSLSTDIFLKSQPFQYVRDGLLSIVEYFLEEPEVVMDSMIAVPVEFIPFIPKEWENHIIPYKFTFKPIFKKMIKHRKSREQLLIKLYHCTFINKPDEVFEYLSRLNLKNYKRIVFSIPYGHSLIDNHENVTSAIYEMISKVKEITKTEVITMPEHMAMRKISFHKTDILNGNINSILWHDDLAMQKFISKGGRPVNLVKEKKSKDSYHFERLSVYHGITFLEKMKCGENFLEIKNFMDNLLSDKKLLDSKDALPLADAYLRSKLKKSPTWLDLS